MTTSTGSPVDDHVFMDFRVADLRSAFNEIANKENWKKCISAIIPMADFDKYNAAAIFFAGSPLTQVQRLGDKVQVFGDGYYARIGA